MPIGKEIKVSVDDSPLNKLRQQTEQIGQNMIRQSREFTTSGREAINYIEEQIRLMERRNQIQEEYARHQLNRQRQSGQVSGPQFAEAARGISTDAGEGRLQVQLLRELIDTVRHTSREEIREDRQGVERQIRQSRTVDQLGPGGDPTRNLVESLQRDVLDTGGTEGNASQPDGYTKSFDRQQRVRRRLERTLNKAASADNEYTFLTSFLEGIPFVGQAAATVAARGITHAENFEKSAISYGRLNRYGRGGDPLDAGRSVGRNIGLAGASFGLTPSDALNTMVGFESALKRDVGGESFTNLVGAQRALGLDSNTITQILTTARYDRSINDPSQLFSQFDKFLKDTGQSLSVLPELAGTFSNAASQILATRGDVDTQSLSAVISNISRSTGFRGQRLDRLTGAFGQLGRTSNPVTRALLMQSFRETDPNASFVDIQEKLEGGISEGSRPGLQRFFEIMRERTGGGDALTLALQTALPQLSIRDIRDVVKTGGFAKALQKQQIAPARDFATEGQAFVGPIEKSSKQISSALELGGDALVEVIELLKEKIFTAINNFDEQKAVSGDVEPASPAEKIAAQNTNNVMNNPVI